jgi:hypothetical protein
MTEVDQEWLLALGYPSQGIAFSPQPDVDSQPTLTLAA